MSDDILSTPIKVNGLELRNRLVFPPMATYKSDGGRVSDELVAYYDDISKGGYLGLLIQEHSYISPEGMADPDQVSLADDSCIEPLKRITGAVHGNGVPIFAQLAHAGIAAAGSGLPAIAPSIVSNPRADAGRHGATVAPREMTVEDIDRIVGCFADAAERARRAGYDGVEIHSAHGYLLDEFYSPLINRRTDAYTGSTLEGRTRIHLRVIEAVRDRVGDTYPVSIRFGASDYRDGGADISDVPAATRMFADAGVDMISISGGLCDYKRPGHGEPGWFAELSRAAKSAVDVPVLLTGGIRERADAERLLEDGSADLIGVGRAVYAHHDLPARWMA